MRAVEALHGIEIFSYLSSCGLESIVAGFLRKSPSAGKRQFSENNVISMTYGYFQK
jgi:hypothetical protein